MVLGLLKGVHKSGFVYKCDLLRFNCHSLPLVFGKILLASLLKGGLLQLATFQKPA